jgi:hypothetical protein
VAEEARRMLEAAGIAYKMVFVDGTLVGGAQDLERLIQKGELRP